MTNLRTDEMAFFHNLTKIGSYENEVIYNICLSVVNFNLGYNF